MDDISKIDFDTYDDDDDVIEIATKKNNKMIKVMKMMTMMVDLPRCWIFKRTTDSTWEPATSSLELPPRSPSASTSSLLHHR